MTGRAPAGWPRDLPPPGTDEYEARVCGWLLDRGPADLRAIRGDLLDVYNERAGIREFDAGFSRPEAERLAAADVSAWLAGHCDGTRTGQKVLPADSVVEPHTTKAHKIQMTPGGVRDE